MAEEQKPPAKKTAEGGAKGEAGELYTHEGLDYPDPPYDPFPGRRSDPETIKRRDAEVERQKALLAEMSRRQSGGRGSDPEKYRADPDESLRRTGDRRR